VHAVGLGSEGQFERAVHDERGPVSRNPAKSPREWKQLLQRKVFFAQLDRGNAALNRFAYGVDQRIGAAHEMAVGDQH